MKSQLVKLAVFAAIGVSAQAQAAMVDLPTAGFAVVAGSDFPGSLAGTTAYRICNTSGNFGSDPAGYTTPTSVVQTGCSVIPGGGRNLTTSPVSTIATAVTAKVTNTITANGEALGTLGQRTWRNAGNTECVFAKYIDFATAGTFDYNPQLAGSQRFEANDIALGGFSTTATVQAGYYHTANTDSPVYRVGRAFTSVQMQSNAAGTAPATNYYKLPLISPAPAAGTEINGVGQTLTPPGNPTQAQQTAAIRTNWVDFVVDNTGGLDEDGTSSPNTPVLYVRGACNGTAVNTANTVRIRQTGQETQPWVTILTTGQTRNAANANF